MSREILIPKYNFEDALNILKISESRGTEELIDLSKFSKELALVFSLIDNISKVKYPYVPRYMKTAFINDPDFRYRFHYYVWLDLASKRLFFFKKLICNPLLISIRKYMKQISMPELLIGKISFESEVRLRKVLQGNLELYQSKFKNLEDYNNTSSFEQDIVAMEYMLKYTSIDEHSNCTCVCSKLPYMKSCIDIASFFNMEDGVDYTVLRPSSNGQKELAEKWEQKFSNAVDRDLEENRKRYSKKRKRIYRVK